MKKLTLIQNELKAPKNQYNSFGKYKYRSCEDILEAVKPLLKKHDCTLTITDEVKEVGGMVFIEAIATLKTPNQMGNEILSTSVKAQAGIDPNRKGMDIAQSFGSSSSYARKYALNGLFLIDDTKDADATNTHGKETPKAAIAPPKKQPAPPKPRPKESVAQPKKSVKFGTDEFKQVVNWIVDGVKNKDGKLVQGTVERAKELYEIDEDELKKAIMVKKELT